MPPASQSSAARNPRTARTTQTTRATPSPRAVDRRLPKSKVGWDRKFRTIMVLVFGLTGFLALKAGLAMYNAHEQAAQQASLMQSLRSQNRELEAQKKALNQPGTIERDARQLGMVRVGERAYVVIHKSGN